MNLANLRNSPLEIALAEPNAHGVILKRSIYGREPLELSLLRVTVQKGKEPIGTVAVSLAPEANPESAS